MSAPRDLLTLGVVGSSRKPDERRVPLHPRHLERVDEDLRRHLVLEAGYGERFGWSDDQLRGLVGAVRPRDDVLGGSDVVLLPKPQVADLAELPDGGVLWGWPHCVQDHALTQVAIDRRLTLIAFEAMNHWAGDRFSLHVFHANNEIAGYASVLHALQLAGCTGHYGRRLTAVVIGFGATARGAVTALLGQGVTDVVVLTHRAVAAVNAPIHAARLVHIEDEDPATHLSDVVGDHGRMPLATFLAQHDVVVNCTLQDPEHPHMYLRTADLELFAPGSVVVDVSCDTGMGFEWARPTSFAHPTFLVGDHVLYYAVDHSPSYLWNSATWEISEALLPFLRVVMRGPWSWEADETIRRAVEIRDGHVQNRTILSFQGRDAVHPHPPRYATALEVGS
ncbi:alanine dehydrogenase [Actinotalea ferrariae CF5-4]|uniref:Alanine dehydrogenase n=1 Tax=Actinotalea ferrariae CF5-4 TaxID=948458 RepID=A0A021VPQ5_9CELL|nr:N(5)-(carboxyethyl)ornithine synthase [Actinotalea ferrariae]EYR63131.1 alanine dehydrogenase [Actinotalea ferrariae CF5-4]